MYAPSQCKGKAVSCQALTEELQVQFQTSACGIYDRQVTPGWIFLRVLWYSPVSTIAANAA